MLRITALVVGLITCVSSFAATLDKTQLVVWANEAIVATYTYDYKNFIPRQREIAKYFTAEAWTAYSTALNAAKLREAVISNSYDVSAVATLPPDIKTINSTQWQASMPVLVIYKNPQYQQKQTLLVTMNFKEVGSGEGVRGLSITSLQSKVTEPACECKAPTAGEGQSPPGGTQSKPAEAK